MAARTTAVLVCALGIALSANQQPSGQRPVFRAGSILVSVDAYPRKDGRVIEGLTKDDFEVQTCPAMSTPRGAIARRCA